VAATPKGEVVFARVGKGRAKLELAKLPPAASSVLFQVQCDEGVFAIVSGRHALFHGSCRTGTVASGQVPLALMRVADLTVDVQPGSTWQVGAWAQ
jgi:hypothetical protein